MTPALVAVVVTMGAATAGAQASPDPEPIADRTTATIETGPRITTSRSTWSLAVTPDAVWAVSRSGGFVARIDPETNRVITKIKVRGFPGQAPANPGTGRFPGLEQIAATRDDVWVTNTLGREVVHIDARRNTIVGRIPSGPPIGEDSFTPYGAPVATKNAVWVSLDDKSGVLSRIDAHTNRVSATVSIPGAAPIRPLAFVDGKVWAAATTPEGEVLLRIDPSSAQIEQTVPHPGTLAGPSDHVPAVAAGGDLWVFQGLVERIDGTTGQIEQQIDIGPAGGHSQPTDADAMAAGGGSVFVRLEQDRTPEQDRQGRSPVRIYRIDAANNRVVEALEAPPALGGVGYGHRSLWVSDWFAGAVYRVEP